MGRLKSAGGVYDIDVHTHHRPELVLGGFGLLLDSSKKTQLRQAG